MKIIFGLLLFVSVICSAQTRIIAHRGYWKTENSAQNSISSLKNAQFLNVYGSEFDVRMTKDGKLIVNHDEDINGLIIADTSYSKLKKIRLKNGEKIPTLKQYLKQGKKDSSMRLIIELKPAKTQLLEKDIVEKAINEVRKAGVEKQSEFISFSLNICKELKRNASEFSVQYLNGELTPSELKQLGLNGFDYHYKILQKNPEWIGEAKKLGLISNSWTVNDPEIFKELKALGIDFITTDIPNEF